MSDLLEYHYGELRKAYQQVVAERDAAVLEIAELRAQLATHQKGSKKNSFRGIGSSRNGYSDSDAGGSSGFTRG